MNKITNPNGFLNRPWKNLLFDIRKIKCSSAQTKFINDNKNPSNTTQEFSIKSIDIKSSLKKVVKYESGVYRSFFGELDADYLNYPTIVASIEESQLLTQQYQYLRENFLKSLNDRNFLKNSGLLNLISLTETEKSYLFEAIGSSLENKTENYKNEKNEHNLITLDKLTVTSSFLINYEEKKKFLKSILPLIIRNSPILNTLQSTNNQKIKDECLSNFENLRIAFAFDEPNDDFTTVPYPYWNSTAILNDETNIWTLNGFKSRIPKNDYDYFLVFCKIKNKNDPKTTSDYGIASFLVQKDQVITEDNGTDNYGNSYLKISFNELNLPKENAEILVDEKATTLLNFKSSGQLLSSAIIVGIMKQLLENMIQVSNSIVPYKKLVENNLTNITEMIYSLESMLYLTSSHFDTFELDKTDLYLQAMIVKIFASEYSEQMMNIARFLFDSKHASLVISNDINDILNVLNCFLDSTTNTRLLLGTYGLKSIGNWRFDHIVKLRLNRIYPLHYYKYQVQRYRNKVNLRYKDAKNGLKALNKLNPLFKEPIDQLKNGLDMESEIGNHLLRLYGKECVKYQIDLNRFCTIVMNVFQMIAVISRTNDSLKKKLPTSEQELLLCKKICKNSYDMVKSMWELVEGVIDTSEETRSNSIHQCNMRFDGYFAKPTFDRVI